MKSPKPMPLAAERSARHPWTLAQSPPLKQLVLYGSQARGGDAEPGSDVDVLVVLRGPVEPCAEIARTIEDVGDLSLQHNVVVACVFVSEEEFEHERSPLLLKCGAKASPYDAGTTDLLDIVTSSRC